MWDIILLFALLAVGIALIVKGGDLVVDVCSKLSDVTGISEVLIGSTIISLATTLPELTITILGMSEQATGLVLGNGFGTVLVNICLVLGLSLCFMSLKRVGKQTVSKLLFMTTMVIVLSSFALLKILNVYSGILFLLVFLFYFIKTFFDIKKDLVKSEVENADDVAKKEKSSTKEKVLLVIKFIVGALFIFVGAQLIINSTDKLSSLLKIDSTFIGLTVVAIGTSLPELVTSIASIKKKRLNLALGNIIGANIINLTLLFSLAMIMSGVKSIALTTTDLLILLPSVIIATMILAIPILIKKRTYRWQGVMLIGLYAVYCIFIILSI